MARAKIDELNILNAPSIEDEEESSSKAFDYHDFITHYFDPMKITDKQKKERIEAAEELFDAILLFFMWCDNAPERVQEEATQRSFENMYKEVLFQYAEPDDYLDAYVTLFIPQLIKVTLDHKGEDYFTSVERAANVAANESNFVHGHSDYQDAILLGYTKKQWRSEKDSRVRPTHREIDDTVLPIDQPFLVGDSLMLYPKDQYTYNANPEEIINCRCSCRYF